MPEEKILYTVEMAGQKAALDELARLRKETEQLKAQNREYNKTLKEGGELTEEARRENERNVVQVKENSKQMRALTTEVQNNGKSTENMRRKLTEMRREMQRMRVAGQQNTEQYRNIRAAAGELQDQIDQVSREIKVFADDAMIMNTVVDAARGMAQGFQLVQSAQALLGFESERFQEVMQRLVATQTLINSLQGVQNMLMKNSRVIIVAKTAAQAAYNKVLAAGAAKMALLTGGISLLIAGAALFIRSMRDKEKASDAFDRTMERGIDTVRRYERQVESLTQAIQDRQDSIDDEIAMMRAQGLGVDEIRLKERQRIVETIEGIKALIVAYGEQEAARARSLGRSEHEINQIREMAIAARERTEDLSQYYRQLELIDAQIEAANRRRREREEQEAAREEERLRRLEEQKRQQFENEMNRAELAQAELLVLLDDSLENQIHLETVKHQQLMQSRDDWTREEVDLMKERHRQRLIALREYTEEAMEIEMEAAENTEEAERLKADAVARGVEQMGRALGAGARMQAIMVSFVKAAALAETIAEISKGTAKNASAAPFPMNIPLIAAFLAQTGGLIAAISQINPPSPPTFARGGIIGGRPHSQGGTVFRGTDGSVFEAERGEYLAIVNKRDAARAAMLDEINQIHGKKFKNGGTFFASGGLFSPNQDLQRFNVEDMIEETVKRISHIPVIVSERDISGTQEKVRKIKVAGDL